jgi:two-component system catabolic regulation response regulator CreB/two-component system response regulator ChvI
MSAKQKYRILVVDDEADIGLVMKLGLEKEGFAVDVFNNPIDAKAQFKPGVYDLLLLDIRMPEINGFQLYRELVKIDPRAKICFITAFEIYYDEFRRVFPKLKVDCFVRKPVGIEKLARVIRRELDIKEEADPSRPIA